MVGALSLIHISRKRDGVVTSVSVGGATTYIASGEIDVPSFALES